MVVHDIQSKEGSKERVLTLQARDFFFFFKPYHLINKCGKDLISLSVNVMS